MFPTLYPTWQVGLQDTWRDLGGRSKPAIRLKLGVNWTTGALVGSYDGGDRGNRTPNLGIANAALSLLSYIPWKLSPDPGPLSIGQTEVY